MHGTSTQRVLVGGLAVVVLVAVVFRTEARDAYIEWRKPAVPSEQPRPSVGQSATVTQSTVKPAQTASSKTFADTHRCDGRNQSLGAFFQSGSAG